MYCEWIGSQLNTGSSSTSQRRHALLQDHTRTSLWGIQAEGTRLCLAFRPPLLWWAPGSAEKDCHVPTDGFEAQKSPTQPSPLANPEP